MRNELTASEGKFTYSAHGALDDCDASVMAFSGRSIVIGIGLGSITLSREAAAELVDHMIAAMDAAGGSNGKCSEEETRGGVAAPPRANTLDSTK